MKARLRKDKVVTRVVRELEAALTSQVPMGKALIFTLGAPIKVPRQLVAALTSLGTEQLKRGCNRIGGGELRFNGALPAGISLARRIRGRKCQGRSVYLSSDFQASETREIF
jgi:hypothetical protein